MIGEPEFAAVFRSMLLRAPQPHEFTIRGNCRSAAAVREFLGRQVEFREVVAPLVQLLQQNARDWQFEPLTEAELVGLVDRTRHAAGSDDAVRAGLRSGDIRRHLAFRPINLEADITNQCNLRCVMCLFSTPEYQQRPRAHLPVERFAALAAEVFPLCHRVSLSYGTEPLLHRDIGRMLAIACSHGVPRTYMNTNGLLLREALVETMVDVGFGSMCVSIDAATEATYQRIRVGGSWQRLQDNLRMVRQVRERRGSRTPEVQLAFVMRRDNLDELPAFVEMAAACGASGVNAMHMIPFTQLDNAADTAFHDQPRTNAALAAAHERARALGVRLVAPPPFETCREPAPVAAAAAAPTVAAAAGDTVQRFDLNAPQQWQRQRHCTFPWNFAAIDAHGNVLPCGWWYGEQPLGNIHQSTFGEVWRNDAYQRLRRELAQRQPRHNCSICPAAGTGSVDDPIAFSLRG